jgi:hypothetical protein
MGYSGAHGDENWPTPPEQAALEEHCKAVAYDNLRDAAWWECMSGEDDVGAALAACVARCMANLDNACKGELIALNAITTALSNLQSVANDMAYNDAMEEEK